MFYHILNKTRKSIQIAVTGGALTLGAGTIDLANVDFVTVCVVAFATVVYNRVREIVKAKINK